MARFDSKVVLVTGAGGGIGRVICGKLANQGAQVVASDQDTNALNATLESLPGQGHLSIPGDLMNAAFCDSLINSLVEQTGRVDAVINNAGVIRRGDICDTSDDDWSLSMSINVDAVFRICRAAVKQMRKQEKLSDTRGVIVNMSSCWGVHPGPNHLAYCTSKAAVASLSQCLGRDHASDGIRVNAVCPNEVNTPMLRSGFQIRGLDPDSAIDELNRSVPLGRIAEPEDIADVVLFLASEESRYICGALIEVNGAKPVG